MEFSRCKVTRQSFERGPLEPFPREKGVAPQGLYTYLEFQHGNWAPVGGFSEGRQREQHRTRACQGGPCRGKKRLDRRSGETSRPNIEMIDTCLQVQGIYLKRAGGQPVLRVFSPDGAPARRRKVAGRRAGRCEEARPRPHGAGGASGSSSGDRPEKSTPPQRLQETKPRKCGPLQGKSSESVCFCPTVEFDFTFSGDLTKDGKDGQMGQWLLGSLLADQSVGRSSAIMPI